MAAGRNDTSVFSEHGSSTPTGEVKVNCKDLRERLPSGLRASISEQAISNQGAMEPSSDDDLKAIALGCGYGVANNLRGQLIFFTEPFRGNLDRARKEAAATRGGRSESTHINCSNAEATAFLSQLDYIVDDRTKSEVISVTSKMRCAQVEEYVRTKIAEDRARISSKMDRSQALTSEEQAFVNNHGLKSASLTQVWSCFTPAAKAARGCDLLTTAAMLLSGTSGTFKGLAQGANAAKGALRASVKTADDIPRNAGAVGSLAERHSFISPGQITDLPMVAKNEKMLGLGFFESRGDQIKNNIGGKLSDLGLIDYVPPNHPGLDRFMAKVSEESGRKVSIYSDFRSPGFKSKYSGTMGDIHESIETVIAKAPNQQAIAFNLTGFDPKKIGSRWSYTSGELAILFSEPRYFNAVRWYENGRQLSSQEVYRRFAPYRKNLKDILDFVTIPSN